MGFRGLGFRENRKAFLGVVRTSGRCTKISKLMEQDSSLGIIAGEKRLCSGLHGTFGGWVVSSCTKSIEDGLDQTF